MKSIVQKELLSYEKKNLVNRILETEKNLIHLRHEYKKAIHYMNLALRKINPNKIKISLHKEFYKLYLSYYKHNTHEGSTRLILKDPVWILLCKIDPMLARLKTPKAFKEKFNLLKKKATEKI